MSDAQGTLLLKNEHDVVLVRQLVRQLTMDAAFSLVDQTKFVTAASEIGRNVIVYGKGGEMHWEKLRVGDRNGLRLCFKDQGPGIADLEKAMTDGWSSGNGLGMGLPGARRLVNEFDVQTSPGEGTCVSLTRWK